MTTVRLIASGPTLLKERVLPLRGRYSLRDIARICETSARTVGRIFKAADELAAETAAAAPAIKKGAERAISVGRVQMPAVVAALRDETELPVKVLALRGKVSQSEIARLLNTSTREVGRIFDAADLIAFTTARAVQPVPKQPLSEVEQLRLQVSRLERDKQALTTKLDKSRVKVKFGGGTTPFGPGVSVQLTGDDVACAIDTWLVAQGVHVSGPRTVTVNGEMCRSGHVYVDPSGFVVAEGRKLSGNGREG